MVEFSSTVHFDKSEPIVFYYEPFQHNYEEPKNTAKKFNLEAKNLNRSNQGSTDSQILEDSNSEVVEYDLEINYEDIAHISEDSNINRQYETDCAKRDASESFERAGNGLDYDTGAHNVTDALVNKTNTQNKSAGAESGHKISNATYFYKILHHLIDVTSDGSRFKCLARPQAEACDSCKIIEKLIFTYFDTTTLEDIGSERVKRGICSQIYCLNPISKSGNKSKYKIDVISKNIYNREEYESFCSVSCLEQNVKVFARMALSPVETGSFTPRAMRCADNETLKKLHDNIFALPDCSSHTSVSLNENYIDLTPLNVHTNDTRTVSDTQPDLSKLNTPNEQSASKEAAKNNHQKGDGDKRIDTFEIYEDFDSCDSFSDSSMSEANVQFDKHAKNTTSIYKVTDSPAASNGPNKNGTYEDTAESLMKHINQESLGMFSLLWYLLSNLVTNNTRDFIRSGIVQQTQFNERFLNLYHTCLRVLPNSLVSPLKLHLYHLMSTFDQINDNLINNKILEPLSQIIIYSLLVNRDHLPLSYNHSDTQELFTDFEVNELSCEMSLNNSLDMDTDGSYGRNNDDYNNVEYHLYMEKVENKLLTEYKLDRDSIEILLELFIEL